MQLERSIYFKYEHIHTLRITHRAISKLYSLLTHKASVRMWNDVSYAKVEVVNLNYIVSLRSEKEFCSLIFKKFSCGSTTKFVEETNSNFMYFVSRGKQLLLLKMCCISSAVNLSCIICFYEFRYVARWKNEWMMMKFSGATETTGVIIFNFLVVAFSTPMRRVANKVKMYMLPSFLKLNTIWF